MTAAAASPTTQKRKRAVRETFDQRIARQIAEEQGKQKAAERAELIPPLTS